MKRLLAIDENETRVLRDALAFYAAAARAPNDTPLKDAGAAEALERATRLSERANRMVADLASAYALAGDDTRARELLAELENKSGIGANVSRYELAIVYAGLGEDGRALAELEAAMEERTWQVVNMGIDPMLNPLRGHPRFQELLLLVGLPSD